MAHVRKQVRDAVAAAVTGLATSGANVFPSRVYPAAVSSLPGILVYATAETSEPDTIGRPRALARTLELAVEALAQGRTGLGSTLNAMAKEIRAALEADRTLGGLLKDLWLAGTEIDLTGAGARPTGRAALTFIAEYRTLETDPTASV